MCWAVELRERGVKAVEDVEVVVVIGWWCGAKEPNSEKVGVTRCAWEKKKRKKIRALLVILVANQRKEIPVPFTRFDPVSCFREYTIYYLPELPTNKANSPPHPSSKL